VNYFPKPLSPMESELVKGHTKYKIANINEVSIGSPIVIVSNEDGIVVASGLVYDIYISYSSIYGYRAERQIEISLMYPEQIDTYDNLDDRGHSYGAITMNKIRDNFKKEIVLFDPSIESIYLMKEIPTQPMGNIKIAEKKPEEPWGRKMNRRIQT